MLQLFDVRVERGGRPVLAQVGLTVNKGELLVVQGARGSGKSSLLAVAAGALRPQTGQVLIGGKDIVGLQGTSLPYVRRNLGYLPAEAPFLRDETPLENVMLPLGARGVPVAEAAQQARDLLGRLGLGGELDEDLARLSASARRLVAVARALVGPAPLLVLDDPTAGLAGDDALTVLGMIAEACADGAAVLSATADDRFATHAGELGARKAWLENGRLIGEVPASFLDEEPPADRAPHLAFGGDGQRPSLLGDLRPALIGDGPRPVARNPRRA